MIQPASSDTAQKTPPRRHHEPPAQQPGRARFFRGLIRIADPKITLASVASMFVGASLAASDGPLAWGWLGLCVLGIFFIEAAKNASGEVFDFDSGADQAVEEKDRSPFSGGKRVLVDGLLSRPQTIAIAAVFYVLGIATGVAVAALREPGILWIGIAGVLIAFAYHAPPLRLSYRGLGELAVGVVYGPLICCGTYLAQRGSIPAHVVLVSVPVGLMIAAFLWINEFPDCAADRSAGKRTLVVRLGRRAATRVFLGIVAVAFASAALLPLVSGVPIGAWCGLFGLPHAFRAASLLRKFPRSTRRIIPAQLWTLLSFLVLAIGMGVGVVLTS